MNKALKYILIGIGVCLFVTFLGVTFGVPMYIKIVGQNEHATAAAPMFPVRKFSQDNLKDNFGIETVLVRDMHYGGIKGTMYRGSSKTSLEDYDGLYFIIFQTEKKAIRAMNYYASQYLDVTNEEPEKYVEGWERDVCDADICCYLFRCKNMLILSEAVYGNFYSSEEADSINAMNLNESRTYDLHRSYILEMFGD